MTPRQNEVLAYLRAYISDHGYPPSVREVATFLGTSIPTAKRHLDALEAQQAITRAPGVPRAIRILA